MKELFTDQMSAKEKENILEQHADKIEETDYYQVLTPDEILAKKEQFFENAALRNKLETDLKDATAAIKEKLDPVKRMNNRLLSEIRTGQIEVYGKLYHIANYDTSMMETFNASGELIGSRRLRPDEKQATIFNIPKQSTAF